MGVAIDKWINTEHRQQFHSEGYMVIRNVVPEDTVNNAVREIAAFVQADLYDSTT